jgi:hypothetical protein
VVVGEGRLRMAFPWKTVGKYALIFAEYALSEREKRKAEPPPVVPVVPPTEPQAPVVPVLTLEQRFGDAVRAIYADELRRMPDAMELWEGMKLLEAGREDELRRNLRAKL